MESAAALSIAHAVSFLAADPVTGLEVVAPVALVPVLRDPVETATLSQPPSLDPDVLMAVPAIVTRCPHEPGTRRRHFHDTRRRGSNLDIDPDGRHGGQRGAQEHRCGHGRHSHAPQDSPGSRATPGSIGAVMDFQFNLHSWMRMPVGARRTNSAPEG